MRFLGRSERATTRAQRALATALGAAILLTTVPSWAGMPTRRGEAMSWGSNSNGQLGTTGGSSSTPVKVAFPTPAPAVVDVVAGSAHTLALSAAGVVYGWGANFYGQLGRGSFGPGADSSVPAPILNTNNLTFAAVAAGAEHSLAVTPSGQVYAWGNNVRAQLALNPQAIGYSAVPVLVQGLPANDPVRAVAAGESHSLALTQSGRIWAWGSNLRGQLGTNAVLSVQPIPAQVSATRDGGTLPAFTAVAAGRDHTLALTAAGDVYAWGENASGQLDDPDTVGFTSPLPVKTTVAGATGVAAGRAHSAALKGDGTVETWGSNNRGQLGRSTSGTSRTVALEGVQSVATTNDHVVAIVRTGQESHVYAWGDNTAGQIGRSPSTTPFSATPATVGSFKTAVRTAAGYQHSLALAAALPTLSTTALTFGGTIEVGTKTPPKTVSLTNEGPGSLRVNAVTFQAGQTDFELANETADGCTGKTLAQGDACSVAIVFAPELAGPRTSFVTFAHDGYGESLVVTLSGVASVVAGAIAITTDLSNLTEGVPASPPRVPLVDIPIQPRSPAAADAEAAGELVLTDLTSIGELVLTDLTSIGELVLTDLTSIGELVLTDLTSIGELVLTDLTSIAPAAQQLLKQVTLPSVPLVEPYAWNGSADATPTPILAGTALAGLPEQEVTLFQVLSNDVAATRFAEVPIAKVSWGSQLGSVGLLAILLGKTPLEAIAIDATAEATWCPGLNASLGTSDCGKAYARNPDTDPNGLTATAMEFQMSGVPYGALPLAKIRLGDITTPAADAPYLNIPLRVFELYTSNLGGIELADMTDAQRAAIVDCSKVDCATKNLYEAQAAGALKAQAVVGDLGALIADERLVDIAVSLLSPSEDPLGQIPLEKLGILPYAGPGTSKVTYTVSFTNAADHAVPTGAKVAVELPGSQFTYVPRSTVLTVAGSRAEIGEPTLSGRTLRWPLEADVPAGANLLMSFDARPGLEIGTFTVNSVALEGATQAVRSTTPSAPVRVLDAHELLGETNGTPETATPIEPSGVASTGELIAAHIGRKGDVDFYSFSAAPSAVPAGSIITINLDDLHADLDLALFYPKGLEPEAPLRDVDPIRSAIPIGDVGTRIDSSGISVQTDVQSDIPLPEDLPLAGLSQNRGETAEFVTALAPAGAGASDRYVIAVAGYNGAFTERAYGLRATITSPPTLPPCTSFSFPHAADVASVSGTLPTTADLSSAQTIFLVAPTRLQRLYGEAERKKVTDALAAITADGELAAAVGPSAVLNVDANDPAASGPTDVQKAFAAWDADRCDINAANDVVRAITALIDRLLPGGGSARNFVVVGGDDAIPFGRVIDLTVRVNERSFARFAAGATTPNNALVAAIANSRVLTDAAYGLPAIVALPGRYLPVPTRAVGRLVEQPSEIALLLNRFRQFRGVVDPQTALTTSAANFLDDVARKTNEELSAILGAPQRTLIDGDWGKTELRDAFTHAATPPHIVAMNGHSDPFNTVPKRAHTRDDLFTTADVAEGNPLLDLILFTAGCHTGTPISDVTVSVPGATEWTQRFAQAGAAASVSQTGYGIGSKSTIALTEKLMLSFAKNLGRYTIGDALLEARLEYFRTVGPIDVFDEKVLSQATLIGMPNVRFKNVQPATYTPPTLNVSTDPTTGLESASIVRQSLDPTGAGYFEYRLHETEDGSYWSANGEIQVTHDRPVQPRITIDVTRPNARAHGMLITGLQSVGDEVGGFDPVLTDPVSIGHTGAGREPQIGNVVFPGSIQTLRTVPGRNGLQDHLTLVPAMFVSEGIKDGRTVGVERRFTSVQGRVLYTPANVTDFDPPVISSAAGVIIDNVATFTVEATDVTPPTDEVKAVVVGYREKGTGTWKFINLVRSPTMPERWTGSALVTTDRADFFVQAVDTNGNVAFMANKGRLLVAAPPPPGSGDVIVSITGEQAANGWFKRATTSLSLPEGNEGHTITYRVNGGPLLYYDQAIEFAGDGLSFPPHVEGYTGDGFHTITYLATNGARGTAVVRIDAGAPSIALRSPAADGSSSFGVGEAAKLSFSCADSGSGIRVDGCTATVDGAPVANGAALPTGAPGVHLVEVRAQDVAGNIRVLQTQYSVAYAFEGFLSPVKNRPEVNLWNDGQTVPMKWRLFKADGTQETRLSVVVHTGSFEIACKEEVPVSTALGESTTSKSTLTHTGDHYQYDWETKKGPKATGGWEGTCRRFVLLLDDQIIRTADFAFK